MVADYVLPAHARLSATTATLAKQAQAFCATPADGEIEAVQGAFADAMDAWQRLRPVTFGPINDFNRLYRIQFWPDKRGSISTHLDKVLREQPEDILKPGGFVFASVAIQGLPVTERLIHGDAALLLAEQPYRCRLLVAVTKNLAATAADLESNWAEGEESWAREVARAETVSPVLGTSAEVATLFLNGVTTELEVIKDLKLKPVLGRDVEHARPGQAESWRSRRSLDNIKANLEALAAIYRIGFKAVLGGVDPDLAALLDRAFDQTLATARAIPVPLTEAVSSPSHRPMLEKLATQTGALRQLIADRAARELGLTLGFNSLDGD